MINPQELIKNVEFYPTFDPENLRYNEDLGFLEVSADRIAVDGLRLLGFATPLSKMSGELDTRSDIVQPLTDFNNLPAAYRTIDRQGKGVGPRLYNIREAFGGSQEKLDSIGVYTFDVDRSNLLDGRVTQGSKVARIARHAGRIIRSKLSDLETVVEDIHQSYNQALSTGELDAVELEMPPLPELRQAARGVETPAGVTPSFIIIRNPDILLHKVGETDSPW